MIVEVSVKKGLIVKNISDVFYVNIKNKIYETKARGLFKHKNESLLVGDHVLVDIDKLLITEVLPRINESTRPRVANINYALIVMSVKKPSLSLLHLDKLLLIYESRNIKPIIIFSKMDLLNKEELEEISKIKKYYKNLGYKVLKNTNLLYLKMLLHNKTAFLAGESGVGKSTLINKLDKNLNLKTSKVSKSLNRGVHTTRHTEIYKVSNFYLVDTPGFSNIDLSIDYLDIKNYFKEFKNIKCEFKDCNHIDEDCEVKKLVGNKILKSRYNSYKRFYKEAYENSSKLYK